MLLEDKQALNVEDNTEGHARCPRDARLQAGLANRFLIERRGAFDWKCCQSGKRFSRKA